MKTRSVVLALIVIFVGACSATPPTAPPPNQRLSAAHEPLGYVPDPRVAASDKRAKEMGYHMEMRHGVPFYCRSVAPLGSRLTQKECLTVDTMSEATQMAEEGQMARRQQQACQGGGCSAN